MSRYVKVKPVSWVAAPHEVTENPHMGDCIGVAEVPSKVFPLASAWWNFSFETITEAEYGTLVAFGIDVLDLREKPPE